MFTDLEKLKEIQNKLLLSRKTDDQEILEKLVDENFIWIVHHVSLNKNAPISVFKKLIKHKNKYIRANLLFNSSVPFRLIIQMLSIEKDSFVVRTALSSSDLKVVAYAKRLLS